MNSASGEPRWAEAKLTSNVGRRQKPIFSRRTLFPRARGRRAKFLTWRFPTWTDLNPTPTHFKSSGSGSTLLSADEYNWHNNTTVAPSKHRFPASRTKSSVTLGGKSSASSKKLCQNILLGSSSLKQKILRVKFRPLIYPSPKLFHFWQKFLPHGNSEHYSDARACYVETVNFDHSPSGN